MSKEQIYRAQNNRHFAELYANYNKTNLNKHLEDFIAIKTGLPDNKLSEEFIKAKKWEIKENSPYFRIVKQGSQMVYLTLHIFTIFLILLMATMRQSFIAFGYVLILLPRIRDGAEVLKQRDFKLVNDRDELKQEIDELE